MRCWGAWCLFLPDLLKGVVLKPWQGIPCLKDKQAVGISEWGKEMLWTFVTHTGTLALTWLQGQALLSCSMAQLIFLGRKHKKWAKNHLQWPAVYQKGKKKFLDLGPRKALRAIPEVFYTRSEAAPRRPWPGSPGLSFGLCLIFNFENFTAGR